MPYHHIPAREGPPALIIVVLVLVVLFLAIRATAEVNTPLIQHRWRADIACRCPTEWRREYQVGRKAPIKWGPFECTHALKNVVTEWARDEGLWNRGDRDPAKPDGYRWDLYYKDQGALAQR